MRMDTVYYIADYCIIRNKTIKRRDEVLFAGAQDKPVSFLTEAYKHFEFSYPKFYKMDNLCKLGFIASEILMQDSQRTTRSEDFGIILYNAASSIDTDRSHQSTINDVNAYFPSPSVFVYTLPNIVIGEICIRHKLYGESAFFITKEFDPRALFQYVRNLFDENAMQSCLAGWIEFDEKHYDCALFRIEKEPAENQGFVIFEADKIKEIYSQ